MTKASLVDERVRKYATEIQARYIDLVIEHGSISGAATAANVHTKTVRVAVESVIRKAQADGWEPLPRPGFIVKESSSSYDAEGEILRTSRKEVPDNAFEHGGIGAGEARDGVGPFTIKGVSTYFDRTGNQAGQWIKTKLDDQKRQAMIEAAMKAMAEDLPRLAPLAKPIETLQDLLNVYTFTDCHVGMLAWAKETGQPWDLSIAERILFDCFERMIMTAPESAVGVIAQLGDWLHFDSLSAVTPTSGHILDADSRFSKMVKVGIRIIRRMVDLALQRHELVVVVLAEGNHDMASSVWLRHLFAALYENEPRVTIIDSELPYYVYQWGTTMLGWHHGHLAKKEKLPLLFAARYPQMWGATTKRYVNTGHEHHVDEKEHPGVKVIQHPTLSAPDAYAARGGWMSEREATAMTFSKRFGLVGRTTVTPEMVA